MEETGVLENPALLSLVLPDFEPGRLNMKPYPWKCGNCHERAVHPVTLAEYSTVLEHDARKYDIVVHNLRVARCEKCGTVVLDDNANRRLSDALRSEAGLLQPAEIRARRDALGLTQKALAGYLLLAEATLSRWETGAQIQQRAMDAFLRVFFGSAEARRILGVPEAGQISPADSGALTMARNIQSDALVRAAYSFDPPGTGWCSASGPALLLRLINVSINYRHFKRHKTANVKKSLSIPAGIANDSWELPQGIAADEPVEAQQVDARLTKPDASSRKTEDDAALRKVKLRLVG
jgi:putative zinc finger/helix-turn-helix YgiT family protein